MLAVWAHGCAAGDPRGTTASPDPAPLASPQASPTAISEILAEADARVRAEDSESAAGLLEASAREAAARGDRLGQGRLLARRGVVLGRAGAFERARLAFTQAVALLRSADDPAARAEASVAEAGLARLSGEHSAARAHLERALAAFEGQGDSLGAAEVLSQLAVADSRSSRPAEALRRGRQALEVFDAAQRPDRAARALSAIAYAHQRLGHLEEAGATYERLIEVAGAIHDQPTLLFAYCNRAEIRRQTRDAGPAEDDLRRVLDRLEASHGRWSGPAAEKTRFLDGQVDAYDRLILLLADTYRGLDAFAVAERYHGRAFLEMLERRRDLHPVAESDLEARQAGLLENLGAARLALDAAPRSPGRRDAVDRLEAELASLHVERQRRDPRWSRFVEPHTPSPTEVQEGLRPGEAMVAYWVSDERLLAWTLTRDTFRLVQVPVGRAELGAALEAYLQPLRSTSRAEDAALRREEERHAELGQRLYGWLYAPLPAEVKKAETLIVIPDDRLHYLPLESLIADCAPGEPDESGEIIHGLYRRCRFLGLEQSLAYNPSAGVFLALRQRDAGRGPGRHLGRDAAGAGPRLLALAPEFGSRDVSGSSEMRSRLSRRAPLAEAAAEARQVSSLFPGSRLLLAAQASEGRFKAEACAYRFLHLATHGLVVDELPMTSGLLLGADRREDGLLQAYEVLHLDLEADVVSLSACRSGRGELRRGEGIVGLTQAFLYAGASSVLVSLWDVDDRSSPLMMESFYGALARGAERAAAAREARRSVFPGSRQRSLVFRARPMALAHPRFWASFVLVGAP